MKATVTMLGLVLSASAFAGDQNVQVASLQVQERLQSIELINVTAEKPVNPDAEGPDAELAAILAEVDALELAED